MVYIIDNYLRQGECKTPKWGWHKQWAGIIPLRSRKENNLMDFCLVVTILHQLLTKLISILPRCFKLYFWTKFPA